MTIHPAKHPTGSYLIQLLASVLHGKTPPSLTPELDLGALYKLAARHNVANMAYYGLIKLDPLPPPAILKPFQDARNKALAREARQELEVCQVLSAFEENQIKHMPLKGYIIKNVYPRPDMRLMADIDILVEESKLNKAKGIMLALGYTAVSDSGNHDVYHKKPVMNIELHRALIAKRYIDLYTYFGTGWERAVLREGENYHYVMSWEDFYIYLIGHMAKHYQNAGTGIRSVIDVWVYKNHFQNQLNCSYIQNELEKSGLYDFTKNMEGLSECWFDGRESNEHYEAITEFILTNGTYGTGRQATLSSFMKTRNDNDSFLTAKLKFTGRILFPGRQHMAILFPCLDKFPFLLPFCWLIRGVRTVLFKPASIKHRLGNAASLTEVRSAEMETIQRQSGLSGL